MHEIANRMLERIDHAADMVEKTATEDAQAGELAVPDKFSRGYLIGYLHALQAAYDLFPDWVMDSAALGTCKPPA